MARVLLIHNPDAGHGQHPREELLGILSDAGHDASYQSASIKDFACVLSEPWDLVAIAGGDGLVTRALRACGGLDAPVAILALGTANNVANGLGHVGEIRELVRRWDLAAYRPFHFGEALSQWGVSRFVESFGVGLLAHAIVAGQRDESDHPPQSTHHKLGTLSERMLTAAGRLAPEAVAIEIDGRDQGGEFLWLEASRVGTVGPNVPTTSAGAAWDEQLRLAVLPASSREQFVEGLERGAKGDGSGSLGLKVLRGAEMRLSWPSFRAHLDGDILPMAASRDPHEVRLRLHPTPVKVLTLQ